MPVEEAPRCGAQSSGLARFRIDLSGHNMNLRVQTASNIGSSWFGLAVTVGVGFFVSPFIIHKLGDTAFGIWILIFTLTGYYGLFDLGIRSSIVKYVAEYVATGEHDKLNRMINTCLFSYGVLALFLISVTLWVSHYILPLFHPSSISLDKARLLLLIVGSALAIGLPLSVFAGTLEGLKRFYLINLTRTSQNVVRAFLIVMALNRGAGLTTLVLITVAIPFASYLVYVMIVHGLLPIHYGLRFVERASFRRTLNFGSAAFLVMMAGQLRFQTDALVVGVFVSASAITYYSIGAKLVDYSIGLVDSAADIFVPLASQFDATGEKDRLRNVLVAGNRFCALLIFPLSAALIIFGKPLIEIWVGPKYVSSYSILVLLLIPKALYRAQAASTRVLFGMARHRPLAVIVFAEGVINLALSILFVHYIGIVGVALGTTLPMLFTDFLFLPHFTCRQIKIPTRTFLREVYLLPLVLCAPSVAMFLLARHLYHAHTYLQLLVQVMPGAATYTLSLLWLFFTKEPLGTKVWGRFCEFFQQAVSR